ncbi:MAG: IS3-like element ISHahy4 family transposase, partial [Sporomusa sp.]
KQQATTKLETTTHGGRPISGYSIDSSSHRISDEQIKEWLMELIAEEEQIYGYHKLAITRPYPRGYGVNKQVYS